MAMTTITILENLICCCSLAFLLIKGRYKSFVTVAEISNRCEGADEKMAAIIAMLAIPLNAGPILLAIKNKALFAGMSGSATFAAIPIMAGKTTKTITRTAARGIPPFACLILFAAKTML